MSHSTEGEAATGQGVAGVAAASSPFGPLAIGVAGAIGALPGALVRGRSRRKQQKLQKRMRQLRLSAQLDRITAGEEALFEGRSRSEPTQRAGNIDNLNSSFQRRTEELGANAFQRRVDEIQRQRTLAQAGEDITRSLEKLDKETERSLIFLDFLTQGAVGTATSFAERG